MFGFVVFILSFYEIALDVLLFLTFSYNQLFLRLLILSQYFFLSEGRGEEAGYHLIRFILFGSIINFILDIIIYVL